MYGLYPVGETDDDKPSMLTKESDNGSRATFGASAPGGSSEDGNVRDDDDDGDDGGSVSAPDEGRRGESYRCGSGVCGRTVAAHPITAKKNTTPPLSAY